LYFLLHNKKRCTYTEGSERWEWLTKAPWSLPFEGDCSATATAVNYWGGAADPSDLNFAYGDTATILSHAQEAKLIIPQAELLPADFILFGAGLKPVHIVSSLQLGTNANPLCFSMGSSNDPSIDSLKMLSSLGEPTFVRNVTRNRHLTSVVEE
jgi:hypothetical protein